MCLPFLKWPGGKRWACSSLVPLVQAYLSRTYYEPFLGGGAVFFGLSPKRAVLSDLNAELMNVYGMTKVHPDELIRKVKDMQVSSVAYKVIRKATGGSKLDRAARFLYLNRTCFGGIYRLNKKGAFNVPYGGGARKPNILWERGLITKAAQVLRGAKLFASDFEPIIDQSGSGDVVYCDPTYTVTHDFNGFVRYNEQNFAWSDQERLALCIDRAVNRGATVILSNAHHTCIKALFVSPFRFLLERASTVSAKMSGRRDVREYVLLWPGGSRHTKKLCGRERAERNILR